MNGKSRTFDLYEYVRVYDENNGTYRYEYQFADKIDGILSQNQRIMQNNGVSLVTAYYTFISTATLTEKMKISDQDGEYIFTSVNNNHPRRKYAECQKVLS